MSKLSSEFLLAALCVLIAQGCRSSRLPKELTPELATEAKLASDLQLMARGKAIVSTQASTDGDKLSSFKDIEAYVDALLAVPMTGTMSRNFFFGGAVSVKDLHPVPSHSILRRFKSDGKSVYYLRDKCDAKAARSVKAWWDGRSILVCPDAHRPKVSGDDSGRMCGAAVLRPDASNICGCGPRLMWCLPNRVVHDQFKRALQTEVEASLQRVVNENRPIEEAFTSNGSVRGRTAELVYRRARVAAGEDPSIFDIPDWPQSPQWHRRHDQVPGHHAGILTSPAMVYSSDALRGVMRNYFDHLWCVAQSSSRVTTEAVLGLEVVDLRVGDGWKKLAAMDVCTDCHARLDYSMQFFKGFPSSTMGVDFNPKKALTDKEMPFYADDIEDERGKGPANPAGFAKLATVQPEFGECITQRVVQHVFHGSQTADDFDAVYGIFEKTHRLKPMLKAALLRYAASALRNSEPDRALEVALAAVAKSQASSVSGDRKTSIDLSPRLLELVEEHCADCHDSENDVVLTGESITPNKLIAMAEQVGFMRMPKTASGMPRAERNEFVIQTVDLLFADRAEKAAALTYFLGGQKSHPVHSFGSTAAALEAKTPLKKGARANRVRSIESAVRQEYLQYTPSVAINAGLTAVARCRESESSTLAACVERATSPETVIAGEL